MTGKILLKLLTVPAIAGAIVAMGFLGLANGGVSPQRYTGTPGVSEAASCGVSAEPGSLLRSLHGDTLMASATGIPLPTGTQNQPDDYEFDVNFSAAESDAAVALFGCDCPACLNALQQLRNQPPAPQAFTSRRLGPSNRLTATNRTLFASSQRRLPAAAPSPAQTFGRQPDVANPVQSHCWVNLQERNTPAQIQAVLQTLEAEEAGAR
ncbi:hypothetical protein [Nodosilinea sp. P-1105]|uniref:hypothetical protein n=1 Tax=Nodosilinea sp. P-1105 TaxID=2546229 RepID=UPI001469C054|nr:hypothetical protein [Nodosilinea sp. P-1105]NMF82330.1 hypothetical protein [Nodosilinea sp. P-1105]